MGEEGADSTTSDSCAGGERASEREERAKSGIMVDFLLITIHFKNMRHDGPLPLK